MPLPVPHSADLLFFDHEEDRQNVLDRLQPREEEEEESAPELEEVAEARAKELGSEQAEAPQGNQDDDALVIAEVIGQLLCAVYRSVNPAKMKEVPQLLAKYRGGEVALLCVVLNKYAGTRSTTGVSDVEKAALLCSLIQQVDSTQQQHRLRKFEHREGADAMDDAFQKLWTLMEMRRLALRERRSIVQPWLSRCGSSSGSCRNPNTAADVDAHHATGKLCRAWGLKYRRLHAAANNASSAGGGTAAHGTLHARGHIALAKILVPGEAASPGGPTPGQNRNAQVSRWLQTFA